MVVNFGRRYEDFTKIRKKFSKLGSWKCPGVLQLSWKTLAFDQGSGIVGTGSAEFCPENLFIVNFTFGVRRMFGSIVAA